MTRSEAVLRQMDAAQDDAKAAEAAVDAKCKHAISALSTWGNRVAAQEAQRDYETDAQRKKEEIERDLTARFAELRREGNAALEADQHDLDAAIYKDRLSHGPKGKAVWEEAQARASFVREDLEAMRPAEIPQRYQLAKDAGDETGAWLVARYGRMILEAEIAERTVKQVPAPDHFMALNALTKASEAPLDAAIVKRQARLRKIEQRMSDNQTKGERNQIYARFGIQYRE